MNRTRVTIDPASAPTLPLITLAARDAPLLRAPPIALNKPGGARRLPSTNLAWRAVPLPDVRFCPSGCVPEF